MYTQVAAIVTIMKLGKVATCENVVYDYLDTSALK